MRRAAFRAAAGYAALGFLWILFSDEVVRSLVDPDRMAGLQSVKGLLFVALSAVYVFAVCLYAARQLSQGEGGAHGLPAEGTWTPVVVFSLLCAAIAGAGLLLHHRSVVEERTRTLARLYAAAETKADRLETWIEALHLDARLLATEAEAPRALAPDAGAEAADARAELRRELRRYVDLHPKRFVLVLDGDGRPLESAGPARAVGPAIRGAFAAATAHGKTAIAELEAEPGEPPVLTAVAAVAGGGAPGAAAGFVVVGMDAREPLEAIGGRGPDSASREKTQLVRLDGDGVVSLSAEKRGASFDLVVRRLRAGTFLAARAARGEEGLVEGLDANGVPSLGAMRRVAGTGWSIVVELDAAEVSRPLRVRLAWTALFLFALLLAAGATTLFWGRSLQARQALRERTLAAERDAVAQHFAWLSGSSNDIVVLTDETFRIVEVNERACREYGYARSELLGAEAWVLRPPEERDGARATFSALLEKGELQAETIHQRRDGTRFPVDFSGRRIEVDGRPFIQYVIRDITERRRAEERIRKLNQLYELLSRANAAIVRTSDPVELARKVCEIAVEVAGFRLAWVSRVVGKDGLAPVAVAGPAAEVVAEAPLTLDPSAPSGHGPTAEAIRGNRPVVENDYLGAEKTSVWHPGARRLGLAALASFPIPGPSGPRGALAVGAGVPGYFDDEIVSLLARLAEDLAFARDAYDRDVERRRAEEALRITTQRLLDAERVGRTGSFYHNVETGEFSWSEGHYHLLGLSPQTFTPTRESLLAVVHPDDREGMAAAVRRAAEGASGVVNEFRILDASGGVRWIEWTSDLLKDDSGRPQAVFGVARDVTEEKLGEERLRLWSHVLEGSADGVLVAGADQRILMVNRAFETMTGYAADEVVGRTPRFLGSGHHDRSFYRDLWTALAQDGRWRGEIQNRRKNGETYPSLLSITAVKDVRGTTTHYVAIYTDLTERVAALERIRFLSQRDTLTHFVNRSGLEAQLAGTLASARLEGQTVALVVLDVDRFSAINESLGGPTGDEILRAIAGRLAGAVRTRDILARIGPDEFAVGFVNVRSVSGCEVAARKIRAAFAAPFDVAGRSIPLSASVGVAVYPGDGEDAPSLMRSADAALRHAKAGEGGGLEFFRRELTVRAMETLETETKLRRAIANGELLLHFQPQVEVETGRIIGAEALVRWNDPERGLVPPGLFIPVAEERGLIVPLGEWVLRAAATQLKTWLEEGLPRIVVAVNVSAAQFRSPDFEPRLVQILEETRVPPELMELEVTESVLARDVEAAAAILGRLRQKGVSVSVDDFGTGYSSLGYLRKFPLQRLKIDQGFVRGIWTDPSAAAIVRTVIGMSRGLGLKVVAEGVEEKRQYSFLRFHGCDEAHGYFIQRPVPAAAFRAFLAAGAFDPDRVPVN